MAQRRRSRRWVFWMLFVALIAVACGVIYLVWDAYFNNKTVDGGEPEPVVEAVETVAEEKNEDTENEEVVEKEKVVQYDGEDPNLAEELTGAITYAGVSGNYLMIRVNIDQYLAGGTCTLGIRQDGGSVYGDTANIVDSAATSTCEGFNVPLSELPGGHYNLVIYLASGEKTGEIHGEVDV